MTEYIYYLDSHGKKSKRVSVVAESTKEADQQIKDKYPDKKVSMFWPNYPKKVLTTAKDSDIVDFIVKKHLTRLGLL